MLRVFVNRANARWVDAREWVPPTVYALANLRAQHDQYANYSYEAQQLLARGQLAFYIRDAGARRTMELVMEPKPKLTK